MSPTRTTATILAALTVAALTIAGAAAPAGAAKRQVPRGWFGMMVDGPVFDGRADLPAELDRMVASGVESIRVPFHWSDAQPYETLAEVPPEQIWRFEVVDGVPTDFSFTDRIVAEAVKRRLHVLPVVVRAPNWALENPFTAASRPRDPAEYARFVTALVRRYGPNGTLWARNRALPRRPLRDWQIWNEPNLEHFWYQQPFAEEYVRLLRAARTAIRSVDRGANIVLGGLVYQSWQSLEKVYRAGGRRAFDIAAIHPFTAKLSNVRLLVTRSRRVMRRYGDGRKPIMLTEMSWTSGKGRSGLDLGWQDTPRGQAKRLTEAYEAFAKVRRRQRIARIYWYTWTTWDAGRGNSFNWAGVRRMTRSGRTVAKPAYHAFRRVTRKLTGCRPTRRADRCKPIKRSSRSKRSARSRSRSHR